MPAATPVGEAQHSATTDRTTQGFVATVSWLRSRPRAVLLEVAWRWAFGIPALALTAYTSHRILADVPWQASGVPNISVNQLLTDPATAAAELADFTAIVAPGVNVALRWLIPLLLVAWALCSAGGRTLVLKAMDKSLHFRVGTLVVLQAFRVIPLALFAALWVVLHRAVANATVLTPSTTDAGPNVMLYVGLIIVLTLGIFVVASGLGYAVTLAPILAMRNNTGVIESVRAALASRRLRSNLVEVNLVLGIVKIALLVLAVVFSATPLPFQSVTTPEFVFGWNVVITVLYLIASDFFHAARLAAYLRLVQQPGE